MSYFDKRVYASNTAEREYDSRLGLYYRFNKPTSGDTQKDATVTDYSGNDITGEVKNYSSNFRDNTSAITISAYTDNTEPNDPVMDALQDSVLVVSNELINLGQNYDKNNNNKLRNFLPEWAQPKRSSEGIKETDHFEILLQLIAIILISLYF